MTVSPNEERMTLYHISPLFDPVIDWFITRIPNSRMCSENNEIWRICTAPTLEGCMLAHPNITFHFLDFMKEKYACIDLHSSHFHRFMERGLNAMVFRVYHFDATPEDVYTPDFLHSQGYVSDALDTGEHWIMYDKKPSKITYLLIHNVTRDEATKKVTFDYEAFDTLEATGLYMDLQSYIRVAGSRQSQEDGNSPLSYEDAGYLLMQRQKLLGPTDASKASPVPEELFIPIT